MEDWALKWRHPNGRIEDYPTYLFHTFGASKSVARLNYMEFVISLF